jgi:hypothetical protein
MMKKSKATGVYKNALAHGGYAQDHVLPWENKQDFFDFHKALREELEPDGPAEEEVVLGVASLYWKKRRLAIGSQLAYRRHPNAAALSEAGENGWRGVGEYLESTSVKMQSVSDAIRSMALAHARALQSTFEKLAALKFPPATPGNEKLDRVGELREESRAAREAERFDALIEALNAMGPKFITPALQIIECQDIEQSLAERAFRPDIIEREVKVGALIDRQIEKGLAQLVHLKEYKRLYKKKQVTGPGTM